MKKIILFICFYFILNSLLLGQDAFNFISSPNTSLQSGKTSTNINEFTGRFGISIPIYQYKSGSSALALNISIDYSSGGINLNQNPGAVGAGWNLNGLGNIYRIINGKPDDLSATAPDNITDKSGYSYAPAIANDICPFKYRNPGNYPNPDDKAMQDSEPDEFQFSFLGSQGTFIIPKGGLYTTGLQPVTKPQSNLKFKFYVGNSLPIKTDIREIVITDDNGIEYWFTALETSRRKKSRTVDAFPELPNSGFYNYEYDFLDEYYVTGWSLTKIIDPNNNEEINLEYEKYSINTKLPVNGTVYDKGGNSVEHYWDIKNYEQGSRQRIKKITFSNGDLINFEYGNYRCDYLSDRALERIKIQNSNILEYELRYVYYKGSSEIPYSTCSSVNDNESRSKWLFLKSIFKNFSGTSTKLSEFEYIRSSDNITSSVDNIIPTRKEAKNQDLWGFYNGGEITSRNCGPLGLCQTPVTAFAEIGSLKKVNYPTGGSSTFEYAGNSILNNSLVDEISYGIRIKKITERDGISEANNIVKEYLYVKEDGKSSGFNMSLPPLTYNNKFIGYNNGSSYTDSYTIYCSSPVSPLTPIAGSPVAYSRVEQIISAGKIITQFRSFSDQPPLNTVYAYPFASKDRIADWIYGLPKNQTIKDNAGNTVKYTEYNYNHVVTTVSLPEFKSMKTAFQTESSGFPNNQSQDIALCIQNAIPYEFKIDPYSPITGRSELTSSTVKDYLKDGTIMSNNIQYEYSSVNFALKKVTSTNSVSEKLEKILFYPNEYSPSSVTYKLFEKNIKSLPVSSLSILTKQDGSKYITGYEKSEFQQMSDFSIRPLQTLTMKSKNAISIPSTKTTFGPEENYGEASNKLTADIVFDKYDNQGKSIQSTSKLITTSAIWDNERKVVVAKANAPINDIAYTSFETNETGNWNYTGNGLFEVSSPAGKKCFNLTGNTISKSLLTASTSYIISYWSNSGSYNVAGTSPYVTGTVANGWAFHKHKVTAVQSVSITGNGLIDELRVYPERARMTSVTYEPFIGLTSESGTEGEITKYDYDSYGRVQSIKDQFGNVLKVFCYNTVGQPSSCGDAPMFKNDQITETVYKDCGPGYASTGVLYTIPQARYVSFISQEDANAKALKDLQTFGKGYADRNGSCAQVTVYARLSYENVYYGNSYSNGDVVVRFFSDANCTQPIYVTNVTINYSLNSNDEFGSYSHGYSVNATGNSIVLHYNTSLEWTVTQCDYGYWPCYTYTYSNNYSLEPSSNYHIAY